MMRNYLILLVSLITGFSVGAQCDAPSSETHYKIEKKLETRDSQYNAKFINNLRLELIQKISTSVFVDENESVTSIDGDSKSDFKSNIEMFSSGILINPSTTKCFDKIIMSIEKNLVHNLSSDYFLRNVKPEINSIIQTNFESDITKKFKLKEQLDYHKNNLNKFGAMLPLVILSNNKDALSSYESYKTQVGILENKVNSFFDDVAEIYNDIKDENYDTAYEKILQQESAAKDHRNKLKTVRKLKKQLKADAKFAYKTRVDQNKRLHRSKVLLYADGSASAISDISGWGGHAQGVLDVGFDYLLSDLEASNSIRNDWFGVGAGVRSYLNNTSGVGLGVDIPSSYRPIIFNSDWNEFYGSFSVRVAKINNVGNTFFRLEYGQILNRFRGKYAVSLIEEKLSDFTQYNNYEQLTLNTAGVKIFLNSTDHSFVPQFYVGYRVLFESASSLIEERISSKAIMHSASVGARIHLRFATKKLTTNRKKLKNEYNY